MPHLAGWVVVSAAVALDRQPRRIGQGDRPRVSRLLWLAVRATYERNGNGKQGDDEKHETLPYIII